ncbi:MAG: nucleoside triphosphate pyrophosphohydrolase [Bacteroidales bacterium]
MNERLKAFERLLDIMNKLREKCPWDKKQTTESLLPFTIEETYELSDAILEGDTPNVCKELGDLLLHIVFYAKIAEEQEAFDIKDVIDSLCDKLIYRHPHVFGSTQADTAEQVLKNWEQLKLKEKDGNKTVLSGVPTSLPALIKAKRVQEKVRAVGFDWEHKEQVWDKVREECNELQHEITHHQQENIEGEFGDLLFSIVNAARLYGVEPEIALERTNQKFIRRFAYLEQRTIKQGKPLSEMSLNEMNLIWEEAKKQERTE